jgi:hypothetical protein
MAFLEIVSLCIGVLGDSTDRWIDISFLIILGVSNQLLPFLSGVGLGVALVFCPTPKGVGERLRPSWRGKVRGKQQSRLKREKLIRNPLYCLDYFFSFFTALLAIAAAISDVLAEPPTS